MIITVSYMSIGLITLIILLTIVVLSCVWQKVNPGILAISATLIVGTLIGKFKTDTVLSFFPIQLFIILLLMSLIFVTAHLNGTLENFTNRTISLIKGKMILLPILFFGMGFLLSAIGPGNITAVAILAPISMLMSKKYKLSPLLTTIMICTGANAGAFSPLAPTGVIAAGLMKKIISNENIIWTVFIAAAILQTLTALSAYLIFLFRIKKRNSYISHSFEYKPTMRDITQTQFLTYALIALFVGGVLIFKIQLLLMAAVTATLMMLLGLINEEEVFKKIPWSVILMVTGIAMLIGLVEKSGGLHLATDAISKTTSPNFINAVLALITGVVSAFSSSSGVVMPAFIPLIPDLLNKMMLPDAAPLLIAVAVGSHMVDVSPLSTLGALSLAAIEDKSERQRVFKYLLAWGMSMSVVGAILAYIFLDVLWKMYFSPL